MTSDHFKAGITVTLFYQSEISTLVEECENVKTNFETKVDPLYLSKIIFSEKSLSVHMSVRLFVCHVPSRPVPSQKKVTKTENFTEQSCQMYFKGDKNTFRVTLMPLKCWARQR